MPDLKPFFTFYGGKWRAARAYPPPQHSTVIEPFAGSAGYALRHHTRDVVLCDADERIAGTWAYLIKASAEEIRRLPLLPPDFAHVDELGVHQEAEWLIGWWLNKGTTHPCKVPGGWMRGGLRPKSYWGVEIRERVASQVEAIKHWQVVHGDYRQLDAVEATWFIDAPYSSKAGRKYGKNRLDYDELATWCQSRRGQVLVCEAAGATWLPFSHHAINRGADGHERTGRVHEVLWTHDCGSMCLMLDALGSEHLVA